MRRCSSVAISRICFCSSLRSEMSRFLVLNLQFHLMDLQLVNEGLNVLGRHTRDVAPRGAEQGFRPLAERVGRRLHYFTFSVTSCMASRIWAGNLKSRSKRRALI